MAECDLLVIGGGINGLGAAVEAARRGLRVRLVEKGDFAGGTTGASSRLIHGGLRYLRHGEFGLVRESLRERGLLARRYPHLIRPIRLLIPAYAGLPPPAWQLRLGLGLYDLLAGDPLFPASERLAAAESRRREPGLSAEGLRAAHVYSDGQLEFPERLCIELLAELRAAGGRAANHTRVTRLETAGGRIAVAATRDGLTGVEEEVRTALVLNAAGPWVDAVNALLPARPPRLLGGTRGAHLVLPQHPEGPRGPVYATARADGRPLFLLPWDGRLLVGTTDVRGPDDPDAAQVEDWEREYLLAETNRLFPGCGYGPANVEWTTVGVRPLPLSRREAGAVTRRHFLVDHARDGTRGLASLVGGKLTTFRSLGVEAARWACGALGRAPGDPPEPPSPLRAGTGRAARLYRDPGVLEGLPAEPLALGSPATVAEALHAIRQEQARTVDDVLLRRLMRLPPTEAEGAAVAALLAAEGGAQEGPAGESNEGPQEGRR